MKEYPKRLRRLEMNVAVIYILFILNCVADVVSTL